MIAVIDYDAGNIKSVEKAFLHINEPVCVTRDQALLRSADRVVLPGVGSFGDAMAHLKQYHLTETIYELIQSGKPFLGICLGLQLLFPSSEESPGVAGLGVLEGTITRIPDAPGYKIPHMGWNDIDIAPGSRLFQDIKDPYVYFVHSYYLKAADRKDVAATTSYHVSIDAAVERGNLFACQFHPEKSSDTGLQILRNFASIGEVE
ncbi:MAG TPA: imidazole glycerol phosphate synthase subunit HisH [Candidatus Onthocola gallistercoris]|uniref:Imidazole glycerol phosphate synthase subunit HisH n=1 Tax=Candidatus Onthocola gallistercoris TaxID=2840876 RepID=A0A9D1HH67_9FIRM|nr:imidazole glycerol phosphate synthase subunit HisH [Candidatus Onthocola gallistercoris]